MDKAPTPTGPRICCGIDWAKDDHVVCIIDDTGEPTQRFGIKHTAAGLAELIKRLHRYGVTDVGIERPDGPVVAALLREDFTVFVVPPSQLKHLRGRYGSAGNKDDRFDAFVLADVIRTDRRRLRPLQPSSPAVVAMRSTVRARRDLVTHRTALGNQLRAHLQVVFPGPVSLFTDIHSDITLKFLDRFPTQARADWLSPARLAAWLRSVGYPGHSTAADLYDKIAQAPRGITGEQADTYGAVTAAMVAVLRSLNAQIKALTQRITDQLTAHPDETIFKSLPRPGIVRAARLLAEIGDARGRFPTPDSLACLSGVAPITKQSGKIKAVIYRYSADKNLRDALCDFAADSRHANPWAERLYNQARARGHDHPHAVRILARAWVPIIWRCWQDEVPYDPTRHRALQTILNEAGHIQAA